MTSKTDRLRGNAIFVCRVAGYKKRISLTGFIARSVVHLRTILLSLLGGGDNSFSKLCTLTLHVHLLNTVFFFKKKKKIRRALWNTAFYLKELIPLTGIRRPESAIDHSSPSNVKIKNEWSCMSSPALRLYIGHMTNT